MHLLITGGTGFIGSRLALHARRRGLQATVTGQTNSPAESTRNDELTRAGVNVLHGPLQDADFAQRAVEGCNLVIHLAAAQHEANVPESYFREVNVDGTRTLLEASRAAGVKRFVYGSTIGVYGEATSAMLDESTPPHPMNMYGRSKLEAEQVVRSYEGMPTSIVRISETYGPGDFRLLKLFKGIQKNRFVVIGAGRNQRQVIHVEDLIQGLLLAGEHPAAVGQTFVMAGQEVMTTNDMVSTIAAAVGRPPRALHAPMWPFMAAAIAMEKTLTPLGIQPPLHRRRLDFFRKSFVFSTRKAEQLLGFSPRIPFSTGARDTAAWYETQGLLARH